MVRNFFSMISSGLFCTMTLPTQQAKGCSGLAVSGLVQPFLNAFWKRKMLTAIFLLHITLNDGAIDASCKTAQTAGLDY